ncbi:DUF4153 domain-containing protein [Halopseudomonas pachastrellae]|nr:DUF4153 domain-containing protein [Halopseudomonas pachastrellae]
MVCHPEPVTDQSGLARRAEQGEQAAWMRWVMVAGKLALLPMMAVAGYALWLRLEQYGLTPERIWALLVWLVLSVMALGAGMDALSSARGGTPNRLLPVSNVAAALVAVLGIVLLLGGPLDPRRLSVDSQLNRLETNRLSEDAFINFLRSKGDGYGLTVLTELTRTDTSGDEQAQLLALLARKALAGRREDTATLLEQVKALPRFPSGSALPRGWPRRWAVNRACCRVTASGWMCRTLPDLGAAGLFW